MTCRARTSPSPTASTKSTDSIASATKPCARTEGTSATSIPTSPVGIVWIALSQEHYGIHGNPEPESVGYSSSHGCVRLTNWDAEEVEHRVSEGVEVSFVDTRSKGMPPVAKKK